MISSIVGMGYLFFTFFLFNDLKSMHILKVPSFFFTITIEESYGIELGLIRPNSKIYLILNLISNPFGVYRDEF